MAAASQDLIHPADTVLRAMTDDGSYRVLVADVTETVRAVLLAQEVGPASREAMAAIVTAAVLIRETMAPANRVQVILEDPAGSQLVGDAFPEGKTRGLARIRDPLLGVRLEPGAVLQVERVIRAGTANRGIIRAEEGDDLVSMLHRYFKQSEQVESMVDLVYAEHDGAVTAAAGYVVQLLPELTDPPRQAMQERLAKFGALAHHVGRHGASPKTILAQLLASAEHTMLAESPVEFFCPCDRDRVRTAASALGRKEIEELLEVGDPLPIQCDYCGEEYRLGSEDFRAMLADLDEPLPEGGDA